MMKLKQIRITAVAASLAIVTGCASSGGTTSNAETGSETVRAAPTATDTVATAVGDTISSPSDTGAATTISGSTETGRPGRGPHDNLIEVEGDASEDLGNYLRRVANVHVIGIGENARVSVRGIAPNRISPRATWETTNPLYIVDGFKWGHDYREIFNRINVSDIKSIRVLKGPEAAMYGSEGANGVIIFNLFSASDPRE